MMSLRGANKCDLPESRHKKAPPNLEGQGGMLST